MAHNSRQINAVRGDNQLPVDSENELLPSQSLLPSNVVPQLVPEDPLMSLLRDPQAPQFVLIRRRNNGMQRPGNSSLANGAPFVLSQYATNST